MKRLIQTDKFAAGKLERYKTTILHTRLYFIHSKYKPSRISILTFLSNFTKVKKYNLPVCGSIFFIVILLNAGFPPVAKAGPFELVPGKKNIYSRSGSGNLHTEIEICSFQTLAASQGNNGFKKNSGYVVFDIKGTYNCIFHNSVYSSPGYASLKQYLSHIYPSHSFW